jgi:hypothetical protein
MDKKDEYEIVEFGTNKYKELELELKNKPDLIRIKVMKTPLLENKE